MIQTITGLGPKATEFLATFAAQGKLVFTTAQARTFWGAPTYTTNVLGRLEKGGWLHRLQRGVYLIIPLEAGPERVWSENALVIATHLIAPSAVAYWSALHYWQFTEQMPRTVFVQSTARKHQREKEILGMTFRFITVVKTKFFGVVERTLNGQPIYLTDREKTLVDAADRLELSGGCLQLAQALQAAGAELDWSRLSAYLHRWPTTSPLKRMGYLVEALGLPLADRQARLARWQAALAPGIVQLEPGREAQGPIVTRWQVRLNVQLPWRTESGA
ncbi:MAG: type IV toxin-antitoxin system AbiEi family antitoxin domain-containing protein [Chloroflexota bacterium]|nr:type IV toxin-antitoxin system AbiEi family antitoxin domain-containing protein [Chloroflexota bacterium]